MATLHVYLDESGDLNFSPRGSRHYSFAVVWTYDPAPLSRALTNLRFELLKQGHNIQSFHATEDRQLNRDAVVRTLLGHERWNFAGLVVEKSRVSPAFQTPQRFYPKYASLLLKDVLRHHRLPTTTCVLVFTDTIPLHKQREGVEKAIKTACRSEVRALPFHSYHHSRASNAWIQVADYCSWAIYIKWERGEIRTYEQLRQRMVATEIVP